MQLLLWAKSNLFISVPVLIVAIFISREILFSHLKNSFFVYYAIMFPGVVLHEFSHLVACLITRAKILDTEFFGANGGHITHSKPKLKYIGTFIISVFPLLTGITIVYFLLPVVASGPIGVAPIILKVVIFYLLTTVIITMFPSSKDFSNAYFIYILLIATSLALSYFLKGLIHFGDKIIYFLLTCLSTIVLSDIVLAITGSFTSSKSLIKSKRRI